MLATPYRHSTRTPPLVRTLPGPFADSYPRPHPAGPTTQTPTFVLFHAVDFWHSLYIILHISLMVVCYRLVAELNPGTWMLIAISRVRLQLSHMRIIHNSVV